MDAKVGDWVVTPRIGKPVEINALWYNALCIMAGFAEMLGRPADPYRNLAERARVSFARFADERTGGLYDVIDGPAGNDGSIRPNQILAVSLPHSPLAPDQQKRIVALCGDRLLTSYGLRSLAAGDPDYQPHYTGDPWHRDGAYHQGTVWAWLLGHYALAEYRVHGDADLALQRLARHARSPVRCRARHRQRNLRSRAAAPAGRCALPGLVRRLRASRRGGDCNARLPHRNDNRSNFDRGDSRN